MSDADRNEARGEGSGEPRRREETPSAGTSMSAARIQVEQAVAAAAAASPWTPRWPRSGTWFVLGLSMLSAYLVYGDPWRDDEDRGPVVSARTGARRVFPELSGAPVQRATIELQRPDGPLIRLAPGVDGHQLFQGDELLGPADPDSLEGIWASLRIATTVRAIASGADLGAGERGVIRVNLPDQTLTLELGHDAPDGSGLYGRLGAGGEGWVVEDELGWLVDQPAEAWLARRLLTVEASEVTGLSWGEALALSRGADNHWRVDSGSDPALLSTQAVERQLDRLLGARLDPLLSRDSVPKDTWRPWLIVTTVEGGARNLVRGGPCPSREGAILVDRGPGMVGCLDDSLVEPWAVDGSDAAMLEARLVPYDYGRVLAIQQQSPSERRLARRTGGWWIAPGNGEDDASRRTVSEDEVFRWYGQLARLETEPVEEEQEPIDPVTAPLRFVVETDSTAKLTLACEVRDDALYCSRDGSAPRRIVDRRWPELGFSADTFTDRRLIRVAATDVMAVELDAPEGDGEGVRQSARLDFGLWRLDAPEHPDGDGALDLDRLEQITATLARLRAERWVEPPEGPPLRTWRIELRPTERGSASRRIDLHEDCVVRVEAGRAAQLGEAACELLESDLLLHDPLNGWLVSARSLELRPAGEERRLLRRTEVGRWVDEDDSASPDDARLIGGLRAWQSGGLQAGSPPTPRERTLVIRRDEGVTITAEQGQGWLRLEDANWFYVEAAAVIDEPVPAEDVPAEDESGRGEDGDPEEPGTRDDG